MDFFFFKHKKSHWRKDQHRLFVWPDWLPGEPGLDHDSTSSPAQNLGTLSPSTDWLLRSESYLLALFISYTEYAFESIDSMFLKSTYLFHGAKGERQISIGKGFRAFFFLCIFFSSAKLTSDIFALQKTWQRLKATGDVHLKTWQIQEAMTHPSKSQEKAPSAKP